MEHTKTRYAKTHCKHADWPLTTLGGYIGISILLHAVGIVFFLPEKKEYRYYSRTAKIIEVEMGSKPKNPAQHISSGIVSSVLNDTSKSEHSGVEKPINWEVYKPQPRYTRDTLEKNWSGEVDVVLQTDSLGFITHIEIKTSSGFPSQDDEIISTLKTWRLFPNQSIEVPLIFKINS